MNTIIETSVFPLANNSASMNLKEITKVTQIIDNLNRINTFKSIAAIHLSKIDKKSFTVEVIPISSGWRRSLSNKLCKEANLNHLKDAHNRLFL